MDTSVYEKIKPELMSGEEPLWCGRPDAGFYFKSQDFFLIPFSLIWTAGSLFIGSNMTSDGAPAFTQLFSLPFVLIGLYLLFGRFFYESWQRKNTYYAVTAKRVLIKQTIFPSTTTSISLSSVSEIGTQERSGGRGDIILQSLSGATSSRNSLPPRLENLPRFREVYETVMAAQAKLG